MGIFDQAYAQAATTGLLSAFSPMPRPESGTARYKISLSIKNGRGQAEDPDNGYVFFRVVLPAGTEFGGETRLYDAASGGAALGDSADGTFNHATYFWVVQDANVRAGIYEAFLQLASTDSETPLTIEAAWYEQGRSQSTSVVVRIGDAADMDDVATGVTTIDTNLGSPVGASISADIAAVQTTADAIEADTQDIQANIGTPVSTLAADVAGVQSTADAIEADTQDIQSTLGTPAGADLAADIAAVKAQTAAIETDTQAIETDTQDIQSKIGTPAGASVSADIAAVQADTDDIQSTLGTPAGADLAADIAAVKAQTAAIETDTQAIETDTQDIQSKIGTPTDTDIATDIANLDTKLGAPAGASVSADIATVDGIVDAIYSAVQGIQNNTKLAAAIPQPIHNPSTGTKAYRVAVSLYDADGAMEDPDEQEICVRVLQTDGTFDLFSRLYKEVAFSNNLDNPTDDAVFDDALGWRAMEREGVGLYYFFYKASASDTVESLNFVFGWQETDVAAYQTRVTEVVDLVDNADAVWDEPLAGHVTGGTTGKALADIETDVTAILADTDVIGSPAGASIAADIAAIKSQTDAIETDTQDIQSKIGVPAGASVSADIAALQSDVGDFSSETNLQSLLAYLGGHFDDIDVPLADYLNVLAEVFEVTSVGVVTVHNDMTTEPTQGDTYLGATSGTTYTWQSTFQDGQSTETMGYWTYSGGTGPQAETLNLQIGSGDATVTVNAAFGGIKLQAHTNGATPSGVDDVYDARDFNALNGTQKFKSYQSYRYDGTSAVLACIADDVLGVPSLPAAGDSVAIWRGQPGNYFAAEVDFGNPAATVMGILHRLFSTIINYQSGDNLPSLRGKIGDGDNGDSLLDVVGQLNDVAGSGTLRGEIGTSGDGPGDNTVMGLLGDPEDAAVDLPNADASVFAALRQILDEVAGVASGSGTQRTSIAVYPWSASGVLSAHPTQKAEGASNTTQSTSYVILDKKTISLPEGTNAYINSVLAHLKWEVHNTDGGGGGNGDTKFMISGADNTETAGSAPSVNADDITSEFATTTASTVREVSGNLDGGGVLDPLRGTGGFHLLLCAKVDDAQDTATGNIYDESSCEIDYEV